MQQLMNSDEGREASAKIMAPQLVTDCDTRGAGLTDVLAAAWGGAARRRGAARRGAGSRRAWEEA